MDEYVKLELLGIKYEDRDGEKWSFATLEAEAVVKREHRVFYEIKWETARAQPNNPMLNPIENEYQLDRKPNEGWMPGDWDDETGKQYLEKITDQHDLWKFQFTDGVEQINRRDGVWWFRLRIVDANENTVGALSTEVEVDWSKGTY